MHGFRDLSITRKLLLIAAMTVCFNRKMFFDKFPAKTGDFGPETSGARGRRPVS